MPRKKKFKKRVRTRMFETGENFTKARQALSRRLPSKEASRVISPPSLDETLGPLRIDRDGFLEEFTVTSGVANARTWRLLDACYFPAFRVQYEDRLTNNVWPAGVITLHGDRHVNGRAEDETVHRQMPAKLNEDSLVGRLLTTARSSSVDYDRMPVSDRTLADIVSSFGSHEDRCLLRVSSTMVPNLKDSMSGESPATTDGFLGLGADVVGEINGNLVLVHEHQPEGLVTIFFEFERTREILQASWHVVAHEEESVPEELTPLWNEPEENMLAEMTRLVSREIPKSETSQQLAPFTAESLSNLLADLEYHEEECRRILVLVAHPTVAERIPDLAPAEIPRKIDATPDSLLAVGARVIAQAWGTTIVSSPRCNPSMLLLCDVFGRETLVEIASSIEAPTLEERRERLLERALKVPFDADYEEVVLRCTTLRDLFTLSDHGPVVLVTRADLLRRVFPSMRPPAGITNAYADNNGIGPPRCSLQGGGHLDLGSDVLSGIGEYLLFLARPEWRDEERMLAVSAEGRPRLIRWER